MNLKALWEKAILRALRRAREKAERRSSEPTMNAFDAAEVNGRATSGEDNETGGRILTPDKA